MMLDAMELGAHGVRREIERGGEVLADTGKAPHDAGTIEREPGHTQGEAELGT